MSTTFPWERLLAPPRPPHGPPAPPMSGADRQRAIVAAVMAGAKRKNAIHASVGGRKDLTLRAIDALVASGELVRGPAGYEVKT